MTRRLIFLLGLAVIVGSLNGAPASAADDGLGERLKTIWNKLSGKTVNTGISGSNGRIEAEQVAISSKYAGRVAEVPVEEGQMVEKGEVVARMDTTTLDAQILGAKAQVRQAQQSAAESDQAIIQRASELEFAQQEYDRAASLTATGHGTQQTLEQKRSLLSAAQAAHRSALAGRDAAQAAIEAAEANVAALQAQHDDMTLTAPRRGRIEYKLIQPGEVVGAGTSIATLLDISNVYLTIFLPAADAGLLKIGDEARIILDPIPQYVVPANVTFVATEAQFTPKSVETSDEREKLMFRVKLRIPTELLSKYENVVKTGVRGIGYVRTSATADWPADLKVNLPQ
ncbi:HlyD family efflux transporter periplasmic adaptor subunit [Kaistia dalseonensis]|uniref:HlyD family secretion protein n=1 Tax=Kaistia dalseonensis TaxID=410840 RepID=A0ABU0H832_9HYPH|nr:HlyD family efflux transporter periplasmic adaptor subunit [Kaistia dalseonensis]MCX5495871.1 HlyD family efflux transporter periplasmic adaptor subunit [Kaistia dalseonensis]MDQ0438472.1 HlyD family secretion protein [Kaistia dalseonensis]